MLGKDHISISIAFLLTFIIPLIFIGNVDVTYLAVLMFSVFIGCLLPDIDCGGKPTLFYKFPEIHKTAHFIATKTIIPLFKHLISKEKIKTEYEVKEEHRGIIHSPIGVLFSSLMLMIPIIIFVSLFNLFNFSIILIIFVGLIIGQFLHLFQDSCTISGINWGFPFKTRGLRGELATFNKADKRPKFYAGMFYFLVLLIVLGYSFDILNKINLLLVYLIILIWNSIVLFLMIIFSKVKSINK